MKGVLYPPLLIFILQCNILNNININIVKYLDIFRYSNAIKGKKMNGKSMKKDPLERMVTGGREKEGLWKTLHLTPVKKKHILNGKKLHKIIDMHIRCAIIILYTKSE